MLRAFVIIAFLTTSVAPLTGWASNEVSQNSLTPCEAEMVANKSLQILKGKLDLLNAESQPLEILANNKKPSKKEQPAIALWVEEQKRCSAPGIAYHRSHSLEVGAIFDQAYADLYISAADLYQGKITYGDFAQATVRRHQALKERLSGVVARFREQQNERARQESFARQQELDRQQQAQQELLARQQEFDRQQHQQQCETLRQQILAAANSGPTPYQVQQQRQQQNAVSAANFARMSAAQRGAMGMYQGGAGLGQMLGGRDPAMEEAQQRQATISQQTELYKSNCQGN